MPDWSDKRPIEELRFGAEWKPTVGDLQAQQPGFKEDGAVYPLRSGDPPTDEVLALWKETHKNALTAVRAILDACGCTIADDIVALGCTGVAHKLPGEVPTALAKKCGFSLFGSSSARYDDGIQPLVWSVKTADRASPIVDIVRFLRMGLGGSGIGLPCYVPADRYCCAHEVSGGLQDGQAQYYPDEVNVISRELFPEERAQLELTDHAKRAEEREAADVLAGRKLPEGWERGENVVVTQAERDARLLAYMDRHGILRDDTQAHQQRLRDSTCTCVQKLANCPKCKTGVYALVAASQDLLEAGLADAQAGRVAPVSASVLQSWECPEHPKTMWACRYCVAQAIVGGEFVPEFLVGVLDPTGGGVRDVKAHDLEAFIETKSAEHCVQVDVHVLVARYTRKLAR